MNKTWKKAAAYVVSLSLLLAGQTGHEGAAYTVRGATLPISRIDEDQILDSRYQWQAKFQKGKTKATQMNCDNVYADQFLTGPRGDWGSSATEGTASLPEGDKQFSSEEAPGCYYSNVGQIELPDGTVKVMDLQIQVVGSYGGKSRYDYRTPSLTTTNPDYQLSGTSLSNITYSWTNGMGRPCVSFMKNSIGLRIYCVDGVDVTFTYFDHQTGKPLAVDGHGTLSDIDGLQTVSFPTDSHISQVYLLKESKDHLEIGDSMITAGKTSLPENSRAGDITYLFENTSMVKLHFSYQNSLENMTANYEKALKQAGSKEKLAEIMKKNYYGSNQETLMPHYKGEEWVTSHATFYYTSKVVGRFVEEPSTVLAKKIGPTGCSWETAQATLRETPYWIRGSEAFDYLVRYELKPTVLTQFTLVDVLEKGLIIDGQHQVTISDKDGKEVTGLFDIAIQDGRTITCKATKEAMEEIPFSNHQLYTFRFRVHKQEGAVFSMEEDNYTFLFPNRATLRIRYQNTSGIVEEKTYTSNQVWAGGRVTPTLQIEKRSSRYEWKVGEKVDYTVKVTQTKQGAWAQNLVITDTDLPKGLVLQDDFWVEEGIPTEHFVMAREGDNGWICTGPLLRYDESVVIHFHCLATEEANGQEWQNYVFAKAENHVDEVSGEVKEPVFAREEIWVNSPRHSIQKRADHFEWQVGEEVGYTVIVTGEVPGTLARDVVISDDDLPEGLSLVGGAEGITLEGIPEEVAIPQRDGKTGVNLNRREPVEYELEASQNGFRLRLTYLPGSAVVILTFRCLVTGDVKEMDAPANGTRPCNQVKVIAENSNPQESVDQEEIYVNTASLFVDKQADHYEWQAGEQVLYQVVVENRYPGTIAREVVLSDLSIPQGLVLQEEEIAVEGIPETIVQPVRGEPGENATEEKQVTYEWNRGENGFTLEISDLPAGQPVTLRFSCIAAETVNGQEAVNTATVSANNGELTQDDARVYVNTASLFLTKEILNPYASGGEQDKEDGRLAHEFRVGEEVWYRVTVENRQPGSIARELEIADTKLPSYLQLCEPKEIQIEGVPDQIQEPAEVTTDPANEKNPQYYNETREKAVSSFLRKEEGGWQLSISDLPYGMPVTITYHCLVREGANGKEIINLARAWARNGIQVQDTEKIWVNTPKLVIQKQADKEAYLVGDTQTYRVEAVQTALGCVARSIVLEDVVRTEGVKLSKGTVVILDQEDQVFDCETAIKENAFAAATGRNLVAAGGYIVWDGTVGEEYQQEAWNPLGEEKELRLAAEYEAEVTDADLAGKAVDNLARVISMEGVPKETELFVPVLAPRLRIAKECDGREYQVGDVVYYHLRIEQTREQVTARDLQIADSWDTKGLAIDPTQVLAAKNQQRLENARISMTENGFTIETGEDLADGEVLDVYYSLVVKDPGLTGRTVSNTATAWGSNATEVTDVNQIQITDPRPVLDIQKTSDREFYAPGETGAYEVKVTQIRPDATARNVVVKDMLLSEGARILPETLAVKNKRGNICSDVEIQYSYGLTRDEIRGYTIYTGINLAEQEFLTICYQTAFAGDVGESIDREVVNTARATADNMIEPVTVEEAFHPVGDGLQAKKTSELPSGSLVKKGDTITYKIIVENTSQTETRQVLIKDKIPEHTKLLTNGAFPGEEAFRGRQMVLEGEPYITFYVANLAPGETCERGFQVQVEEAEETDMILNAAQLRLTTVPEEEVKEDTYRSGNFYYTNETAHFVDTLWVSTQHRVQLRADGGVEGRTAVITPNTPKEGEKTDKTGNSDNQSSSRTKEPLESSSSSSQKGTVGVYTGDETPLIELLLGLGGSLILIAVAAVVRIRRKRR